MANLARLRQELGYELRKHWDDPEELRQSIARCEEAGVIGGQLAPAKRRLKHLFENQCKVDSAINGADRGAIELCMNSARELGCEERALSRYAELAEMEASQYDRDGNLGRLQALTEDCLRLGLSGAAARTNARAEEVSKRESADDVLARLVVSTGTSDGALGVVTGTLSNSLRRMGSNGKWDSGPVSIPPSTVSIARVKSENSWRQRLDEAVQYHNRARVEECILDAREWGWKKFQKEAVEKYGDVSRVEMMRLDTDPSALEALAVDLHRVGLPALATGVRARAEEVRKHMRGSEDSTCRTPRSTRSLFEDTAPRTLIVMNVDTDGSRETVEALLREAFSFYGELEQLEVDMGLHRAIVRYVNSWEARTAANLMQGKTVGRQQLIVTLPSETTETAQESLVRRLSIDESLAMSSSTSTAWLPLHPSGPNSPLSSNRHRSVTAIGSDESLVSRLRTLSMGDDGPAATMLERPPVKQSLLARMHERASSSEDWAPSSSPLRDRSWGPSLGPSPLRPTGNTPPRWGPPAAEESIWQEPMFAHGPWPMRNSSASSKSNTSINGGEGLYATNNNNTDMTHPGTRNLSSSAPKSTVGDSLYSDPQARSLYHSEPVMPRSLQHTPTHTPLPPRSRSLSADETLITPPLLSPTRTAPFPLWADPTRVPWDSAPPAQPSPIAQLFPHQQKSIWGEVGGTVPPVPPQQQQQRSLPPTPQQQPQRGSPISQLFFGGRGASPQSSPPGSRAQQSFVFGPIGSGASSGAGLMRSLSRSPSPQQTKRPMSPIAPPVRFTPTEFAASPRRDSTSSIGASGRDNIPSPPRMEALPQPMTSIDIINPGKVPAADFGNSFFSSGSTAGPEQPASKSPACVVCRVRPINTVILNCAHIAICMTCGEGLESCPVCRSQVIKVIQTYAAT
mmetsp:Transcript_41674/g.67603  ORF Transcript_41674/g.67603 Transcript_41674/m.67603 type:complete len:910 (+) Transcript_41674:129-2858(+)|eukprot:CAMPEP_0184657156 /NCGR_PEP_ID=MMETSP0308-20130426/17018_1 /TAXON_ID=38269 /ORGANISM="Gloeochaete witrockiana, Strain SAG 46.84" /LENGTH=909 /DNA_ID=CAMNT_0027094591 /DNA_START=120 /DNA_END=2849 /DNA_ORIENTATION=-